MKNKKLTYVLLPAVVLIWIMIGQRFYSAVKGDDYEPNVVSQSVLPSEVEPTEPYVLQLNYADPFLKKEPKPRLLTAARSATVTSLPTSPRSSTPPGASMDWNSLVYLGIIENNKTTHRVGIVTLDGVRKLVKKNDRVAPFVIEEIRKDSIRVRSGQNTKYILRQGRIKWLSDH